MQVMLHIKVLSVFPNEADQLFLNKKLCPFSPSTYFSLFKENEAQGRSENFLKDSIAFADSFCKYSSIIDMFYCSLHARCLKQCRLTLTMWEYSMFHLVLDPAACLVPRYVTKPVKIILKLVSRTA